MGRVIPAPVIKKRFYALEELDLSAVDSFPSSRLGTHDFEALLRESQDTFAETWTSAAVQSNLPST